MFDVTNPKWRTAGIRRGGEAADHKRF